MSLSDIGSALDARLNELGPSIPTAWENTKFNPVNGTPYQRVYLLPTATVNPTFGDNQAREEGIYQVTLCYPELNGSGAALERAELVRGQFARGLTLTSGTITLRIKDKPYISPARYEDGLYLLDVSITYFSYF